MMTMVQIDQLSRRRGGVGGGNGNAGAMVYPIGGVANRIPCAGARAQERRAASTLRVGSAPLQLTSAEGP
jgi:hypothetical protein